jgi:hypothetical protein
MTRSSSLLTLTQCDEGKPHCQRCIQAEFECDGYPNNWITITSQQRHRPPRPAITVDQEPAELRSIQYFLTAVVPSLAEPCGTELWQQIVPQLSHNDVAVRHAVLAISTLYEDFHRHGRSTISNNRRALGYYNRAISELLKISNESVVLLVCVLFVCIESLQGNADLAIQHCLHGTQIIQRRLHKERNKNDWLTEKMAPLFRHFSMMPSSLGQETFVDAVPVDEADHATPWHFSSHQEAAYHLDTILVYSGRLNARGCHEPYAKRDSKRDNAMLDILKLQITVLNYLQAWSSAFDKFVETNPFTPTTEATYHYLCIRAHVYRLGALVTFTPGPDCLDKHVATFRELARLAEKMSVAMHREFAAATSTQGSRFSFEMGPLALLLFSVARCPELATRLRCLKLIKNHWAVREGFWDREAIYGAGKEIIEFEHGIVLDEECKPVGLDVPWEKNPMRRLGHEQMTLVGQQKGL